jgi:hypothetical protein
MTSESDAAHWDGAYALGETTCSWFQEQTGHVAPDAWFHRGLVSWRRDRRRRRRIVSSLDAAGPRIPRHHSPRPLGNRDAAGPAPPGAAGRECSVADRRRPHLAASAPLRGLARPGRLSFPDHRPAPAAIPADPPRCYRAVAVFGCFAPDGPQQCSGLPAARYSPPQLTDQLGGEWLLISQDRKRTHHPGRRIRRRRAGRAGPGVAGRLLAGQSLVDQVDERPVRRRFQSDDHGGGSWRQIGRTFPAPGEDDPPARLYFAEGAGQGVPGNDGPPVVAASPNGRDEQRDAPDDAAARGRWPTSGPRWPTSGPRWPPSRPSTGLARGRSQVHRGFDGQPAGRADVCRVGAFPPPACGRRLQP